MSEKWYPHPLQMNGDSLLKAFNSGEGKVRIDFGTGPFRAEVIPLRSSTLNTQEREPDTTELFSLMRDHVLVDKLVGEQINNLSRSSGNHFALHVLKTETN